MELHVLLQKTPAITASSILWEFYRVLPNLYVDEITKLIKIKTQPLRYKKNFPQNTHDNFSSQTSRVCLPQTLFFLLSINFINSLMLVCILHKISSIGVIMFHFCKKSCILIYDDFDFQLHKHRNRKKDKAAILPFPKLVTFFIHGVSMDTKAPINPASDEKLYFCIF